MDKKKIIIVTGTGGILGTGHTQRMLNLAHYINNHTNYLTLIYLKQNEHPLEENFNYLITGSIPSDTTLIIRDMRDSSIEEMQQLKKIAPVLAIDDSGEGNKFSDYSINLLPVPADKIEYTRQELSRFLYGYNFAEGIKYLSLNGSIKKDIDVTIYAGYNPSSDLLALIKKSIPDDMNSVLLAGGKPSDFTGNLNISDSTYAEIIARSRIVITHFGLTMFEAHACGCSITALNPTSYHDSLTKIVSYDFDIIYSSEYNLFSPEILKKIIHDKVINTKVISTNSEIILKNISSGTENFIKYLTTICIDLVDDTIQQSILNLI